MKKLINTMLLTALTIVSVANASDWCNESHPDFQKLNSNSGCLPRPVILVHGINTDPGTWGLEGFAVASEAQIQTLGRQYWTNRAWFRNDMTPTDENPWLTMTLGYKDSKNIPKTIADYYGLNQEPAVFTSADFHNSFTNINFNGLHFYSSFNKLEAIPEQARLLKNYINYLLTRYYGEDWRSNIDAGVDIIAHSQGGIVTRTMIDLYGSNSIENPMNHINHIITIGTPHAGVEWATENSGEWAVDYTMEKFESTYRSDYFSYLPNKIKSTINTLYDQKPFWNMKGEIVLNLSSKGNPINGFTGEAIPLTTFYSSCDGCAEKILNSIVTDVQYCDSSDWFDQTVAATINAFPGNQGVSGKEVCDVIELTKGVVTYGTLFDWLHDFDQYNEGVTSRPWSYNSDFVSSVESQRGDGIFSKAQGPYQAINLGNDVLHISASGLKGQNVDFGPEILNALLNPPVELNIVPTIIIPLLLN